MSRTSMLITLSVIAFAMSQTAKASDTLAEYAKKCDAAIGETVSDFDCDAGQAVPEGRDNGKKFGFSRFCDWPNVLNHQCDPGSKFQVLKNTDKATIVAHCRTKKTPNDGMYGDIAVIQYSKVNGATCFYQQLEGSHGTNRLPAKVEAPSKGNPPWFSPARTAAIRCGECHDNGPFIRSPYLAHLGEIPGAKFTLPGSQSMSFNDTEPYAFVGDDFKNWKAYKIEIDKNSCTDCHRMGVSNLMGHAKPDPPATAPSGLTPVSATADPCTVLSSEGGSGTSRVFGVLATLPEQCMKFHNLHTWMIPFDYNVGTPDASKAHRFSPANFKAAKEFRDCAFKWALGQSLPAGCKVTLFAKRYP